MVKFVLALQRLVDSCFPEQLQLYPIRVACCWTHRLRISRNANRLLDSLLSDVGIFRDATVRRFDAGFVSRVDGRSFRCPMGWDGGWGDKRHLSSAGRTLFTLSIDG